MKKYLFLATAVAGMMLAGCSNDDFVAETPTVTAEEANVPILFSSNKGNITRANDITGAAAAELLGNKFVVSGYKGSKTANVGTIVFDNYLVEYAPNTAYTTESNTHNWEYVGKGRIKHAIDNVRRRPSSRVRPSLARCSSAPLRPVRLPELPA